MLTIEELRNSILQGDVLENLKKIPDESIDCVITSPPYWRLRSYLPADHPDKSKEIGLEDDLEDYLEKLLLIFAEIKRVMKKTGVFFLNWGDSYFSQSGIVKVKKRILPEKCLCMQNYRGILKMIDDLRKYELRPDLPEDDKKRILGELYKTISASRLRFFKEEIPADLLPYFKPIDPYPETGHYILRNQIIWVKTNYFPSSTSDRLTNAYEPIFMLVKSPKYYFNLDAIKTPFKDETLKRFLRAYHSLQKSPVDGHRNILKWIRRTKEELNLNKKIFKEVPNEKNNITPLFETQQDGEQVDIEDIKAFLKAKPSDVWFIPTESTPPEIKGKFFARFPQRLVYYLIQSGCPALVCQKCGLPHEKIKRITSCQCNAGFKAGIVLDPFAGSGTTLIVAKMLKRDYIGIELSEEFCNLIKQQLKRTPTQFSLIE
jgi:DNA modification methylase